VTLTGRLERVHVGMGAWVLTTAGAHRYELLGDLPSAWDGAQVTVSGDVVQGMTSAMVAPEQLRVLDAQLRS